MKEINAEILACQNGFSTHEDSALRITGSDFTSTVAQLSREAELLKEIAPAQTGAPADPPERQQDDEEEEEDKEADDGNEGR